MLIAVEGIDGAGKHTLVQELEKVLNAEIEVFPRYGTSDAGLLIRRALYGHMGDLTDSPYAMAALFALDRADLRDYLRAAAEDSERVLLLDRYVASNAAYTAARMEDMEAAQWVYDLEFGDLRLPKPHLQILLDIPTSVARERAEGRAAQDSSRSLDAYESDDSLQTRTATAYRSLARGQWASPWVIVPHTAAPADAARDIAARVTVLRG